VPEELFKIPLKAMMEHFKMILYTSMGQTPLVDYGCCQGKLYTKQ